MQSRKLLPKMIFKCYFAPYIAVVTVILFDMVFCKLCYTAGFSEDCKSCSDFKNNFLEASNLKLDDKMTDKGVSLKGTMELREAIKEGYSMRIACRKETPMGDELMMLVNGDICSNLNDKAAMWYPFVSGLNATKCPIDANLFNVDDMSVDLNSYAKDVMTHEYVGDYWIEMAILDGITQLSCYVIGVVISEESCDD